MRNNIPSLWESLNQNTEKNLKHNYIFDKEKEKKEKKDEFKIRKPREYRLEDIEYDYIDTSDEESDIDLDPLLKLKLKILQNGLKESVITGKPNKEKPNKEKPNKEKPIKEKPIKEKPNKEKPIKEKPNKEKPNKEEPKKEYMKKMSKEITKFLKGMIEYTEHHKFNRKYTGKKHILDFASKNAEFYKDVKALYDMSGEIEPYDLHTVYHQPVHKNKRVVFGNNSKKGGGKNSEEWKMNWLHNIYDKRHIRTDEDLYSQAFFEDERREQIYEKYPEFRTLIKKASDVLKLPENTPEDKERKKWGYTLVYGVPYYQPYSKKIKDHMVGNTVKKILKGLSNWGWVIGGVPEALGVGGDFAESIDKGQSSETLQALKDFYDKGIPALKSELDLKGLNLTKEDKIKYWSYVNSKEVGDKKNEREEFKKIRETMDKSKKEMIEDKKKIQEKVKDIKVKKKQGKIPELELYIDKSVGKDVM